MSKTTKTSDGGEIARESPPAPDSSPPRRPTGRPLKLLPGCHTDAMEMVEATAGPTYAEHFRGYRAARKLVGRLVVARLVAGITQSEMAKRMKCTQSKVSKFEASEDADLSFGDVVKYCKALGLSLRIAIGPDGQGDGDGSGYRVEENPRS